MYPQQKTNIEFLKELTLKNLYYSNGDFNVIGEYLNVKKKILLKDKYSFHKMSPDGLLRGNKLTANSSTDKKQYCENVLKEFGINLSLVDVSFLNKVIYNTEHGLCVSPFSRLLKIKTPNISSAIDKTVFMISEFTKIHNDKYNYEKSVFNNAREKIKIECKIHGYFE